MTHLQQSYSAWLYHFADDMDHMPAHIQQDYQELMDSIDYAAYWAAMSDALALVTN